MHHFISVFSASVALDCTRVNKVQVTQPYGRTSVKYNNGFYNIIWNIMHAYAWYFKYHAYEILCWWNMLSEINKEIDIILFKYIKPEVISES